VNCESAAWAGLMVGVAMAVAPLAPPPPVDVGTVPEAAEVAAVVPIAAPSRWTGLGPVDPPHEVPDPAAPPVRLVASGIGVDAPVVPVGVDPDRALAIPADPSVVGWWQAGARPGSAAGSVVLAGHVDTRVDGPGALFRLASLRPRDAVVVDTPVGTVDYVVDAVRRYPKVALPPEVFATTGRPRLVLITCGGDFDRRTRHYADNVVVYATPVVAEPAR
jgi:Sortase domain